MGRIKRFLTSLLLVALLGLPALAQCDSELALNGTKHMGGGGSALRANSAPQLRVSNWDSNSQPQPRVSNWDSESSKSFLNESGPKYPTQDPAQMEALGFTKRTTEEGKTQWVRPAPGTTNVTQDPYDVSSKVWAGSSQARGGGNKDWPAAPRGDRPPIAETKPAPKPNTEPGPFSPPSTPAQPTIDTDKLINGLVDKLANDPRFRGPAGPAGADGKPGPAGPAGPAGKDAVVDEDKIVAAVMARIDIDNIATLAAGKIKPPSLPVPAGPAKHYVLVADVKASYWARLEGELNRAREYYSGIDLVERPDFVRGPMPKLVVYEDATPIQTIEGLNAVSSTLAELAR